MTDDRNNDQPDNDQPRLREPEVVKLPRRRFPVRDAQSGRVVEWITTDEARAIRRAASP